MQQDIIEKQHLFDNTIFVERPSGFRGPRYLRKHESREEFAIEGPEHFQAAVYAVLQELLLRAPSRYDEALSYLPQAIYDISILTTRNAAGLSSGEFSIDGIKDGHRWFRYVFLHEVGHCIAIANNNDYSEKAATTYAQTVVDELKDSQPSS